MKNILFVFILFTLNYSSKAQLKFLVEDFEGLADGTSDLKLNGLYVYGNVKATIEKSNSQLSYSGDRYIKLNKSGKLKYGGWGKGLNINIELNPN